MLLAVDFAPRLAFLGLILARHIATENTLEGAGFITFLSSGLQWIHKAASLHIIFTQGSDPRSLPKL